MRQTLDNKMTELVKAELREAGKYKKTLFLLYLTSFRMI